MYILSKLYGVSVFNYDSISKKISISKKCQIIFPILRSIILLMYLLYFWKLLYQYENSIFRITFAIQKSVVIVIAMLLIKSQIFKARQYAQIINKTIRLVGFLNFKLQTEDFFNRTFFILFATKFTTNSYVILVDLPHIFNFQKHWTDIVGVINLVIVWISNIVFFNFAFIGLLVASAFYENLFKYFQKSVSLREINEFRETYKHFKCIFKSFLLLTELHFFYIYFFYMINMGAGLSYLIINDPESVNYRTLTWGYQICCIIDLMLFNIAADFVLRSSRKADFHKVDFLRNDSIDV